MGNASLFGRQLTNASGLSRFDSAGVQIIVYHSIMHRTPKAPSDEGAVSEADWGREKTKTL